MQSLTKLTCYVQPALEADLCYAYPSFLPQLTALKYLKFAYDGPPTYCHRSHLPQILLSNIPDSVMTLYIGLIGRIYVVNVDDLLVLTKDRPHLTITFEDDVPLKFHQYFYDMIFSDPLSISHVQFSYVNSLSRHECKELNLRWPNFHSKIKEWLILNWTPLVEEISLVNEISWGPESDPQLEEWCYNLFPNLSTIYGRVEKLPIHAKKYSHSGVVKFIPSPQVGYNTHPNLTSMDIGISDDQQVLPTILPETLQVLNLVVKIKRNPEPLLRQLVHLLPKGLRSLNLTINHFHGDKDKRWNLDLVEALPRGLRSLYTNYFPAQIEYWRALPPHLTDFNVVGHFSRNIGHQWLDDYTDTNYQTISPNLTKISTLLYNHSPDVISLLPELSSQMSSSTLQRFQSLVSLELQVIHPDILLDGITGLPLSLQILTLNFHIGYSPKIDLMSKVELPQRLQNLIIAISSTGPLYWADFQQWYPLPDSLTSIELSNMNINALPVSWPKQLQYLELYNCTGLVHPQTPSTVTVEQLTLDKLLNIPNVISSLSALPQRCMISTDIRRGQIFYILVDRSSQKLTIRQ